MRSIASLVVCVSLLGSSVALAAPTGKQKAIELFDKSAESYRQGYFDEAAQRLTEPIGSFLSPTSSTTSGGVGTTDETYETSGAAYVFPR